MTMWSFEHIKLFQGLNDFFYAIAQALSNKAFYFDIPVDFPWKEGVLITAEHRNYPPIFINFISKYLDVVLIDFVKEQQQ